MLSVWCPACGKSAVFSDEEGGQPALCRACGQKYLVPGAPLLPGPFPYPVGSDSLATVDADFIPLGTVRPTHRELGAKTWAAIAAGACLLLVLIALRASVWAAELSRDRDRTTATRMLAQADAALTLGKAADAKSEYEALGDFVAYRQISDPFLKRLADAARAGSDKAAALTTAHHNAGSQPAVAAVVPSATQPASAIAAKAPGSEHREDHASASANLTASASQHPTTVPAVVVAKVAPAPPSLPKRAPVLPPPVIQRPAIQPVVDYRVNELTDEQIGQSIQHGVDWLIKQFDSRSHELQTSRDTERSKHTGMDALVVYALLQCGQAINDPRLSEHGPFVAGMIRSMKALRTTDEISDFTTYSRSIRATALALLNRGEDRPILRSDAGWLLKNHVHGAYTYSKPFAGSRGSVWDNSNSQYGLLGVWSAAEVGVEVPTYYWKQVQQHWEDCQCEDGGWSYVRSGKTGDLSMTCAGVASLFVCHDWIDAPNAGSVVGRAPFPPALQRGLDWLEDGDRIINVESAGYWGYALYGIERVGLASGFKYFGRHNWYPELCRQIINRQNSDGSWGADDQDGGIVDTAYALLFLSRGRHPILMNKARFDGHWANHPRDLANLSRWTGEQMERPLNWQVVPISHPWTDWTDSPILYIASHEPVELTADELQNVRDYVKAGGMLFLQADGDSKAFDAFARDLSQKLFPQYPLVPLPAGHPLLSSLYNVPSPPPLLAASNGSRILVLYSPQDISKFWQTRDWKSLGGKPMFQLGTDIFIYAAGKRDLRNRLDNNTLKPIQQKPATTINVARIKYDGNWDPEPYAWTRYANWFQRRTGYALNVKPVSFAELNAKRFPIAQLTGTARYNANGAEIESLRKYVNAGGVLLIDTCGGSGDFDDGLRSQLFSHGFSGAEPTRITSAHPLLNSGAPGMENIGHARLRPYSAEQLGGSNGVYLSELAAGRGHVILSPLDITSGLLNTNTWGILGFDPAYSQALMKNLILWTLDGQKDE